MEAKGTFRRKKRAYQEKFYQLYPVFRKNTMQSTFSYCRAKTVIQFLAFQFYTLQNPTNNLDDSN